MRPQTHTTVVNQENFKPACFNERHAFAEREGLPDMHMKMMRCEWWKQLI